MGLYDFLANDQTQTSSLAGSLCRYEKIKNLRQNFWRDSPARICNLDDYAFSFAIFAHAFERTDFDAALSGTAVDSVVQQIE